MFVFMLLASGLLTGWGAFLLFTGDYIATLDIAASLISAGVISFCLALLTRTLAQVPEQIARHSAALNRNAAPAPTQDTGLPQANTSAQLDVSSITKAIAKATTPPQTSFTFPDAGAGQPALPLAQDKKPEPFAENKLPPLPPVRSFAPAPQVSAPTPAPVAPPAPCVPLEPLKPIAVVAPAVASTVGIAAVVAAVKTEQPKEVVKEETAAPALPEPPVRLAQRPVIPPMPTFQTREEKPEPEALPEETLISAADLEEEREFLKEGNIDGTTYRFYSDGSAETDTPEGVRYFASIDEVRNSILMSRISLDIESEPEEEPAPAAIALAAAFGLPDNWNDAPAPEQAVSASPFDFSPSRFSTGEAKAPAAPAFEAPARSAPALDMPAQNNAAPDPFNNDEWAEPFRMLLRKDKNSQ